MKTKRYFTLATIFVVVLLPIVCVAQVNSGSNGSDGALNPTTNNLVINMADHPNGIYQYTSVNISNGVTVTFIPNANNSPVTWLVQGDVVINGTVDVSGRMESGTQGGNGGPGGSRGGNAALSSTSLPGAGLGPGGGTVGTETNYNGGNGSFATLGERRTNYTGTGYPPQFAPGPVYGNQFCLPLLGGSGGSGGRDVGGGGGGGALLIATSGTLSISGSITARGGRGYYDIPGWGSGGFGGAGSGGAIRLVATTISGSGTLDAGGGSALYDIWSDYPYGAGFSFNTAGSGRIRLDGLNIIFNGPTTGAKTSGFQPIIIPTTNQIANVVIQSIGGVVVSASPTGVLTTPDAIISAQQSNPVPVVVRCSNLPLNTLVTVTVKPANGAAVSAVGYNNTGTLASSTATISITMPRGGGIIYATAAN